MLFAARRSVLSVARLPISVRGIASVTAPRFHEAATYILPQVETAMKTQPTVSDVDRERREYRAAKQAHKHMFSSLRSAVARVSNRVVVAEHSPWAFLTRPGERQSVLERNRANQTLNDLEHSVRAQLGSAEGMSPADLAPAALAFALAGRNDPGLFDCMAMGLSASASYETLSGETIAWLARAFASTGRQYTRLFDLLGDELTRHGLIDIRRPKTSSTATNSQSALASVDSSPRELEGGFTSVQQIVDTAWAFAHTGYTDADVYIRLVHVLTSSASQLNNNSAIAAGVPVAAAARLALVLAQRGIHHPLLFERLAEAVCPSVERMTVGDDGEALAELGFAFALAGQPHDELFARIDAAVGDVHLLPSELTRLSWACATVGFHGGRDGVFGRMSAAVERLINENPASLKPVDAVTALWALATNGRDVSADSLLVKLEALLITRMAELSPHQIITTSWALSTLGRKSLEFFNATSFIEHWNKLNTPTQCLSPQDLTAAHWVATELMPTATADLSAQVASLHANFSGGTSLAYAWPEPVALPDQAPDVEPWPCDCLCEYRCR